MLVRSLSKVYWKTQASFYSTTVSQSIRVGIVGAGRIGQIHADSISRAGAHVVAVADPFEEAAKEACDKFTIPKWTKEADDIFTDKSIQAVIICSPTNVHAAHMEMAADMGKHIFCEKPVDLDLQVVSNLVPKIEAAGVHCMIGFNRRFDSNAVRIRKAITDGEIGDLNLLRITSYDPSPPPVDYLKISGGMFCDMTIHDFDMARYLTGDEVEEVYAVGHCRDPAIAAVGDIDTAMILLTFKKGSIVNIENSRVAAYGYDQRLEALGTLGGASSANRFPNEVTISNASKTYTDLPHHFFLDRYMESYVDEMKQFVTLCTGVQSGTVLPGINDGLQALRIAKAAALSHAEKRSVNMSEIQ